MENGKTKKIELGKRGRLRITTQAEMKQADFVEIAGTVYAVVKRSCSIKPGVEIRRVG